MRGRRNMSSRTEFAWNGVSALDRAEAVLARMEGDPAAASIFTKQLPSLARQQAQAAAQVSSPLAGALVSVKALFDVEGEVTTSASKVLADNAPAEQDASCIARLRQAGAVFTGLTNMSEFAYSGIGLNPHYGTPANPAYPGCAPGGSTSGGAVAVALDLCDITIGSDTGGSLRIPAAFTGITGFKPTQKSVPMDGGNPLSDTLDSFGPMAKSVAACELAWQVMAGRPPERCAPQTGRLIVPENFGLEDMDPEIAAGFSALKERLRAAGFEIAERRIEAIELHKQIAAWHLTSVESRAHYEAFFQNRAGDFDPRVHARMARADEISAVTYRQTLNRHKAFVRAFADELGADLLLLPTVPILPPALETLRDDEAFNRLNLLALRNPSLANSANGCSVALPFRQDGLVLSAMLTGAGGMDVPLLAAAKAAEAALSF